ncbi:MAG: hypothetical protein E7471_05325 [Ruminococcaceae bacterium]|nr:hypothetical protein [Oscillospiraceae bacterium]
MKKRVLSLLLVFCMLLSFVPVMAAETETEITPAYYYNFMRLRHGQWSTSAYQPHEVTTWGWEDTSENYHNYLSDSFIYYGKSEGTTWQWVKSSANLPEFGPHFLGSAGEWVAWTIRVETGGTYLPVLTHAGLTSGGKFNAYLAPLGAENPRDTKYFIGDFDTYRASTAYQLQPEFDVQTLDAGDYIFTMEVAPEQVAKAAWVSALSLFAADGGVLKITADAVSLEKSETKTVPLTFSVDGTELNASDLTALSVASSDTSVATAELIHDGESASVKVSALKSGSCTVTVSAACGEVVGSHSISVTVAAEQSGSVSKTKPTYMTMEKREAAQQNIAQYDWAQQTKQNAIALADFYVGQEDLLWSLITSQDLPRACNTAARWDPEIYNCHYCDQNLVDYTGDFYPWKYDVINNPWKLQCPACRNYFPSNDFGKFYEAGINEHGFFDYELAKKNGSQYLTNDLYPQKGAGWGVDDGYGYRTGESYSFKLNTTTYNLERTHTYIAYYNHWAVWYGGAIRSILGALGNAYIYTGDIKYGRLGAIMVDRIADVYPDMYVSEYFPTMANSDFNTARGRVIGGIWETGLARDLCMYYDYFYPAYDDESVVAFLSDKAKTYSLGDARGAHGSTNESRGGVGNDKSTSAKIRQNIENGLLREVIKGVRSENQIYGNSGMHQSTATMAAVVLDTMPDTANTLDWVMGSGGNVTANILSAINRDGQGNEAAPGYADTWVTSYLGIVDALESYDGYAGANLYDNVKFVKLLKTNFPLTLARNGTAPIGDSGGIANNAFNVNISRLITAFQRTKDPEIAQYIYFLNGNQSDGIQASIFTPAETIADDIQAVVDTHGEYPFDESSAMTGSFGYFALRDGTQNSVQDDTQRDFWMYFGRTTNHGHPAVLNIGIDAYGVPVASDFGYPESTSETPRTLNWDRSTIIHNTVQVNDVKQSEVTQGTALHFDGDNDGRVQVMDARVPGAYSVTSEYRRTLVMVDYDDDVSYGVDFFRVIGGNTHTFAFHPVSNTAPFAENLTFTKQSGGTYAGPGVEYGNYAKASGYDGFYDVSHATPTGPFSLDYKITDFRKLGPTNVNLHLKITQLNDFIPTQVSIASAEPPQTNSNPSSVRSLLVSRKGSNLDSLFTTVYEPYDAEPYIAKSEVVSVVRTGGATPTSTDKAYAVKVTMENGREDYIIYATNNQVAYQVDGWLDFQGFVGVVTRENGIIVNSFISDGTKLGDMTATASYTGKVKDFTKTLSFENTITVTPNTGMDLEDIVGRYVFIKDKAHSYKIKNAVKNADGTVTLDVGDFSFVNGSGYTYDIAVGNNFEIPLTKEASLGGPDVTLTTINGAQIRMKGDQGLRFFSTIEKSGDFGKVKEFGTILIPTADIKDISELEIGATLGGHTVAKVPAKNLYAETDDTITFTAVITQIAEQNYTRAYTARAYAILEDGRVVYSDTGASRSVYEVAKKGLENPDESETNKEVFRKIVAVVESQPNIDNDYSDPWN